MEKENLIEKKEHKKLFKFIKITITILLIITLFFLIPLTPLLSIALFVIVRE